MRDLSTVRRYRGHCRDDDRHGLAGAAPGPTRGSHDALLARRCRCGSSSVRARQSTWRGATWRTPRKPRGTSTSHEASSRSRRGLRTRGETYAAWHRHSTVWETSLPRRAITTRPGGTIIKASLRYRQIDDRWGIARVLSDLASIDLQAHDYAAANALLKEALQAFRALGHQRGVARQLESLSWCAGCQARDEEAIVLASAAAAIRQKIGTPRQADRAGENRPHADGGATRISDEAYASAWREGRTATLDRVLEITTAPHAVTRSGASVAGIDQPPHGGNPVGRNARPAARAPEWPLRPAPDRRSRACRP